MLARILCSTAILAAMGTAAVADETTIHLLHFNDFHSRVQPISRFDSTCSVEDDAAGECFGGAARLETAIEQIRAEEGEENVAVVAAGDLFQGSLMYTTFKGDVEAEMMNAIGLDLLALGNHEFDDGPENLARFMDLVEFPVIGGNLDLSQSDLLRDLIGNSYVQEINGVQVGFVSAVTPDTVDIASPGPNVIFEDVVAAMQADVDELLADGVNVIVAVTHVGAGDDERLAAEVSGLDAIIGGHSHSYYSADDPDRDYAYPTYVSNPDGDLVPIVSAGAYTKYLGHLDLTVDDDGDVVYAGGNTILLDASFEPDALLSERIAELAAPIEEAMAIVVAETTAAIDGDRSSCRARECEMGVLVADAMLDRVRNQGIDIAIQNGGGLRASIDPGEVTMGEVLTVLPFQNTLSTFQITGDVMLAALENGVSDMAEVAGRFPQVAGITFTVDPAAEVGSRISDVMVGDAALDPAATYGVVSNNYVRNGGDGYKMFKDAANAYDFGPDLADVTAEYMAAKGAYTPYTDGRITVK